LPPLVQIRWTPTRVSYDLKQDDRGKTSATNLKAVEASETAEPANDQPADASSGEAE
jgi:hypothetical protein